jgi:transcriptional regulator with XRE-family HTH domain
MIERILSVIKNFNLSPSDFAEEIGVQRSSISHLISGRNKPSLEFIQRIFTRYPEINPEWILNGKGKMLKNGIISDPGIIQLENGPTNDSSEIQEPVKRESQRIPARKKAVDPEERLVEKIIYLYRDKTFREYNPE